MNIRDSFSRLKKKLKHPLTGNRQKPGRSAAGTDEERVDPTDSLPRPKPHVVDRDQEGGGANEDGRGVRSTDRPPQPDDPEPVPAQGKRNDREERGGRGVGQKNPHTHPTVEVAVGSGHGGEGNNDSDEKVGRVYPSPSTPSIPHDGEPDSM